MLLVDVYTIYALYMSFVLSLYTIAAVNYLPLLLPLMCYSVIFKYYGMMHQNVCIQIFVLCLFYCLTLLGVMVISPFSSLLSPLIMTCGVFVLFVVTVQSLIISAPFLCCVLLCHVSYMCVLPCLSKFLIYHTGFDFQAVLLCLLTCLFFCP